MTDTASTVTDLKKKGNDAYERKEYNEAITQYTAAIALDGSVPALWTNRSACLALLNKHEESLQDANKAISLDPTWAKVLLWPPKGHLRVCVCVCVLTLALILQGWFRAGLAFGRLNQSRNALLYLKECASLELKQLGKISTIVLESLDLARRNHIGMPSTH